MELDLDGRRILVTGAAGGIGAAVVRQFVEEGAALVCADARPVEAIPGVMHSDVFDASSEISTARMVDDAVEALGGLDSVVSCTGISGPFGMALTEISCDAWSEVMAINVTGTFLLFKHTLPHLLTTNDPSCVVIASDSAFVVAEGMSPYCASKAAVLQLVRAAAVENPTVRFNAVCPSIVDTPMSRRDLNRPHGFADALFPVQSPKDVASEVAFLCSSRARAVNATGLVSDFGYSARSAFPA